MSRLSSQIAYNTIGNTVTLVFQWVIVMAIPKITDFSDAGVFAVALSITSLMNIVATMNLAQYQVADQYEKFTENDYFVSRLFTIILSFLFCGVAVIVFGYSTKQALVIFGYMIYRNFIHFANLHLATLQINSHLDYVGKCMIVEGVVSFISFIVPYILIKDLVIATALMAFIGGGVFLLTLSYGYRRYMGRKYPMCLSNHSNLIPMIMIGIPLMLSIIVPIAITSIPKLELQYYWGDEIVGVFSTLTAPTIIIPTLIVGVFSPFIVSFSNMAKRGDFRQVRFSYLKLCAVILLFGLTSLVVSILCAKFFFVLLYGEYIVEYIGYFHVMIVGIIFYSIGVCGTTVLVTKDQGKEAAILAFCALALSIVLMGLIIPSDGFRGATYSLLAAYVLFALFISAGVLFRKLNPTKKEDGTED